MTNINNTKKSNVTQSQKNTINQMVDDQKNMQNALIVERVSQIKNDLFLFHYTDSKSFDIVIINKKGEISYPAYNLIYIQ